ncbi:choice-of-anchor I family protein [Synechococcus sp. EJ6-Ellesmere]|uniref:choice-of-anchor I family protein n=1 Tax=Synechococcus sp. EJ6-Ellesmere TaxID=2823734 RepID=UPI0020CEF0E9|nr:choice-of-anchor I family protein [Synechococcus sp. EJ6-Ellesmere]MCP9824244.1 choice-of-anchor I family protein [Synechococcus sp. EJ6-Ellesmere]
MPATKAIKSLFSFLEEGVSSRRSFFSGSLGFEDRFGRGRGKPPAPANPLLASIDLSPTPPAPGAAPTEQFQTEISAYVNVRGKLFILSSGGGSTLQVTDATDPSAPKAPQRVTFGSYISQSVATHDDLVAVALSPSDYGINAGKGLVRFYRIDKSGSLTLLKDVKVGYLPDGIAFSDDGKKLVIANEGEPIANYAIDRPGSIGIIDIKGKEGKEKFTYTDLGFAGLTLPDGIRISGPAGTTQATDIEPEYVSILGNYAYVTLQENNGVAKVNLKTNSIERIFALGSVDFSTQLVDITDRDGPSNTPLIKPTLGNNVAGLRMPDGVAAFSTKGKDYFITANEGDGREYGTYLDETRRLGRLKTLSEDTTAPFTAFGSRSVSIFDANSGALVWDSGNTLQTIAIAAGVYDDTRSDDKGVEPEGVVVKKLNGRTYAIVSAERGTSSLLAVFDITQPAQASFVTSTVLAGSVSPEGLLVIDAKDSPTKRDLLVVSNEVSNTLNILDLGALIATPPVAGAGTFTATQLKDVEGGDTLQISSLITVGEFTNGLTAGGPVYVPTGIFDGQGAFDNGDGTFTLLVNSEVSASRGYQYLLDVMTPGGSGFEQKIVDGARINRLIVDKDVDDDASNGFQAAVIGGGLAYDKVVTNDAIPGFDRFCSANLMEANTFGSGLGFVDRTFLVGEETSANGGGIFYALDVAGRTLYQVAGVGKGAWESATLVDSGNPGTVAMLLFDDGSAAPDQGSPLYLWVGAKEEGSSDFLRRNGLAADQGSLYVWKTDGVANTPAGLDTVALGAPVAGYWVLVGSGMDVAAGTGYFATADSQRTYALDTLGAMQFLRIEDGDVNPLDGSQAAFNTTGGTYSAGILSGDYYGTTYTIDFNGAFDGSGQLLTGAGNAFTDLRVISDADRLGADAITGVRSPDNIAWGSDGFLYVQEDKSTRDGTAAGQFGPQEASIWKLDPNAIDPIAGAAAERWLQVDRTAVPAAYGQSDGNPSQVGNWETSGIIEVSGIFGAAPGSVFLSTVQAHSLINGNIVGNPYLAEGGQLNLIQQTPPLI